VAKVTLPEEAFHFIMIILSQNIVKRNTIAADRNVRAPPISPAVTEGLHKQFTRAPNHSFPRELV